MTSVCPFARTVVNSVYLLEETAIKRNVMLLVYAPHNYIEAFRFVDARRRHSVRTRLFGENENEIVVQVCQD